MGCGGSTDANPKIPPQPPYLGPPCKYRFENFMLEYVEQIDLAFTRKPTRETRDMPLMTLDEKVYTITLGTLYDLDYRLLTFTVVPASVTVSGFLTANVEQKHKYQGVCRKLPEDELPQQWFLKVVKSYLPSKAFTYGKFRLGDAKITVDSNHIFETIANEASNGGRLVCVEVTGFISQNVKKPGASATEGDFGGQGAMNVSFFGQNTDMLVGVDIFLEIPRNPSSTRYVYQCVTILMKTTYTKTMASGGKWNVEMDWAGVTSQYLGTGWKLVEVFLDQNNNSSQDGTFTHTVTINQNCIFFFEKEQSKLNDETPVYEATMLEYNVPGKITRRATSYYPEWEPFLDQLGTFGWELVQILDTPATKFDIGFGSFTLKKVMWMFFQRKIVAAPPAEEPSPSSGEYSPPTPAVPPD